MAGAKATRQVWGAKSRLMRLRCTEQQDRRHQKTWEKEGGVRWWRASWAEEGNPLQGWEQRSGTAVAVTAERGVSGRPCKSYWSGLGQWRWRKEAGWVTFWRWARQDLLIDCKDGRGMWSSGTTFWVEELNGCYTPLVIADPQIPSIKSNGPSGLFLTSPCLPYKHQLRQLCSSIQHIIYWLLTTCHF